jgi:hypothetical protein
MELPGSHDFRSRPRIKCSIVQFTEVRLKAAAALTKETPVD